nr:Chain D, nonspecific peptide AALTRA [synthetic construct]2FGE_E Chain E, nonspecific peptide AALTRA [synthetic construct]
AALTRA